MKIAHYTALVLEILMAAVLIWINYSLFWPVRTMEIKNFAGPSLLQTTTTTYKLGQPVAYELSYCKYTTVKPIVTRTLLDGQEIPLTDQQGYLADGCHTTLVETTIIPTTINPGTYYLDIVVRYPINPFRTEVVRYHTNEFEVVK